MVRTANMSSAHLKTVGSKSWHRSVSCPSSHSHIEEVYWVVSGARQHVTAVLRDVQRSNLARKLDLVTRRIAWSCVPKLQTAVLWWKHAIHLRSLWAMQLNNSIPGLATYSIFFCVLFVKTHWFAWRANQWPLIGETQFSSVPPSNSLVSVSEPRKAFWADMAPFSGPRLASCVASGATEVQGHWLFMKNH